LVVWFNQSYRLVFPYAVNSFLKDCQQVVNEETFCLGRLFYILPTMAGAGAMETPLMKQYNAIKAKYPGALLLFRVGDFYETFGDDAIKAARVLDITLTKRGSGSASEIELAGFPHHSLDTYLPKLVRAGHRVAICDQLEDPKSVKGIV
jgi:DNA mismatch repair protein MutS